MRCKLPALMKAAKINQKELAQATGLSPTTVGKLYRGHFDRVDTTTITVLLTHFQLTSLDDLFEVVIEDGDFG